jgi:hypothetical protein
VRDQNLDGLTLVAGVVLPRALDELAGDKDPHALAKRAVDGGTPALGQAGKVVAQGGATSRAERRAPLVSLMDGD